jgi:hypothetical protein
MSLIILLYQKMASHPVAFTAQYADFYYFGQKSFSNSRVIFNKFHFMQQYNVMSVFVEKFVEMEEYIPAK